MIRLFLDPQNELIELLLNDLLHCMEQLFVEIDKELLLAHAVAPYSAQYILDLDLVSPQAFDFLTELSPLFRVHLGGHQIIVHELKDYHLRRFCLASGSGKWTQVVELFLQNLIVVQVEVGPEPALHHCSQKHFLFEVQTLD